MLVTNKEGCAMKNKGKIFEEDFHKSAFTVINIDRLKDPPSSFNIKCQGCDKQVSRFSPKNICDFIGYKYPSQYYFELKSHKGKSIPFSAIKRNPKDTRLFEMVLKERDNKGVFSFVIFNWRDCGNETYAVKAESVNDFINYEDRKSIPYQWTEDKGIRIPHRLKRVRYSYEVQALLSKIKPI